jgi:hypothetical protein
MKCISISQHILIPNGLLFVGSALGDYTTHIFNPKQRITDYQIDYADILPKLSHREQILIIVGKPSGI